MSYWAQLNTANIVTQVVVCDTNDLNGDQGYQFLLKNFGGTWVQTDYNGEMRKNFAGIGFTYDSKRDAFIAPKPFESWVLVEKIAQWGPPTPYPLDEKSYQWDEETTSWKEEPNA